MTVGHAKCSGVDMRRCVLVLGFLAAATPLCAQTPTLPPTDATAAAMDALISAMPKNGIIDWRMTLKRHRRVSPVDAASRVTPVAERE
jgi:hypothetical protein